MPEDYNVRELAAGPLLDRLVARALGWDIPDQPTGVRALAGANPEPECFYDHETQTRILVSGFRPSSNAEQALAALRRLQSEDWRVEAKLEVARGSPEDEPYWDVSVGGNAAGSSGHAMEYSFALALSKAMAEFGLNRGEK